MFVIFVGALAVFLIIGMLLAWVGNKVLLAILKDNAKAEKEIELRKTLRNSRYFLLNYLFCFFAKSS